MKHTSLFVTKTLTLRNEILMCVYCKTILILINAISYRHEIINQLVLTTSDNMNRRADAKYYLKQYRQHLSRIPFRTSPSCSFYTKHNADRRADISHRDLQTVSGYPGMCRDAEISMIFFFSFSRHLLTDERTTIGYELTPLTVCHTERSRIKCICM